MSTGINVTKPIKILDEGVQLTADVSQIDFTGGVTATTVGNNVTVNVPAAGITVGTTPITSGTDTRVFFQAGGVIQQDANFTFDNTLKRLTLKAVGTAATDIPFAVQNSAGTTNHFTVYGNDNVGIGRNSSANAVLFIRSAINAAHDVLTLQNSFYGDHLFRIRDHNNGQQSSTCSIFIGGRIYGGNSVTQRQFDIGAFGLGSIYGEYPTNTVLLNNEGNVGDTQGSTVIAVTSNVYINNQTTKKYKFETVTGNFGIGNVGSLGARLDVRAQGALSTDIAFRVRNSADTSNIVNFNGNGEFTIGLNAIVNSTVGRDFCVVIGQNAISGPNSSTNSDGSITIGYGATGGYYGVAIGRGASSAVSNGVAIGASASVTNNQGVAIGGQTSAAGNGTAVGMYSSATAERSSAFGYDADATSDYGVAIGAETKASAIAAVTLGTRFTNTISKSFVLALNGNYENDQSLFVNRNSNMVFKFGALPVSGTDFEVAATNTITIHNGTAPTTNIATAGQLYAESGALRYRDSAGTITNVGGSVQAVVSAATVTPVYTNKFVKITAQAAALTLANPTGTWAEGQDLMIRIKDDGTARAITWDTNYRAIGVTLPTTTVINKTTYVGIIYNSTDGKWDAIGVTTEA